MSSLRCFAAVATGTRNKGAGVLGVETILVFFWGTAEEQARAWAVLKLTEGCPEVGNITSYAEPCPTEPPQ